MTAFSHLLNQNHPQVVVLVVPFPAQGHLNQLLHLSRLVSAYNIPVHYVGTTTHIHQAKFRVHGWDPLSASTLHFHEFPTPLFVSPPPNPISPLSHLQPCFEAASDLRKPFATLLNKISADAKRIVVVHDTLMSSVVQDVVSVPNAEAYAFHSISAFGIFINLWEKKGKPFEIQSQMVQDLPTLESCFTPEFTKFVKFQFDCMNFISGRIYNTCRAIESPYLDLLAREEISNNKKQWALGPFNPVSLSHIKSNIQHECLKWLDKQAPNSVIYVSFGTTTSLIDEQIQELAIGLENCGHKFLWVLRDADKGDIFSEQMIKKSDKLPEGYEERIEGKGMILRNSWAPQTEILEHSATVGFMSHCGWNSCMESITMGVPILAWPMHSDQPRNAVLITKFLKIGLVVKDWGRGDELVRAEKVESVIRRFMGSDEGEHIRRRTAEMGGDVRNSVADGGASRLELDSFVAHISR